MKDYVVHIRLPENVHSTFVDFAKSKKWTQSLAGCEIISEYLTQHCEKNTEKCA